MLEKTINEGCLQDAFLLGRGKPHNIKADRSVNIHAGEKGANVQCRLFNILGIFLRKLLTGLSGDFLFSIFGGNFTNKQLLFLIVKRQEVQFNGVSANLIGIQVRFARENWRYLIVYCYNGEFFF